MGTGFRDTKSNQDTAFASPTCRAGHGLSFDFQNLTCMGNDVYKLGS